MVARSLSRIRSVADRPAATLSAEVMARKTGTRAGSRCSIRRSRGGALLMYQVSGRRVTWATMGRSRDLSPPPARRAEVPDSRGSESSRVDLFGMGASQRVHATASMRRPPRQGLRAAVHDGWGTVTSALLPSAVENDVSLHVDVRPARALPSDKRPPQGRAVTRSHPDEAWTFLDRSPTPLRSWPSNPVQAIATHASSSIPPGPPARSGS
jgi:hypothetical protein